MIKAYFCFVLGGIPGRINHSNDSKRHGCSSYSSSGMRRNGAERKGEGGGGMGERGREKEGERGREKEGEEWGREEGRRRGRNGGERERKEGREQKGEREEGRGEQEQMERRKSEVGGKQSYSWSNVHDHTVHAVGMQ